MKNPKIGIGAVIRSWIQEHAAINREADKMAAAILNLRVESKSSAKGNLQQIQDVLEYFDKTLMCHIVIEENSLFPFLDRHVPKLEVITRLLRSEHVNIKEEIKAIKAVCKKVWKHKTATELIKDIETLRESGAWLVHLLRGHVQEENQSVYRAVTHDLHPDEQKTLVKAMKKCRSDYLGKYNSRT